MSIEDVFFVITSNRPELCVKGMVRQLDPRTAVRWADGSTKSRITKQNTIKITPRFPIVNADAAHRELLRLIETSPSAPIEKFGSKMSGEFLKPPMAAETESRT